MRRSMPSSPTKERARDRGTFGGSGLTPLKAKRAELDRDAAEPPASEAGAEPLAAAEGACCTVGDDDDDTKRSGSDSEAPSGAAHLDGGELAAPFSEQKMDAGGYVVRQMCRSRGRGVSPTTPRDGSHSCSLLWSSVSTLPPSSDGSVDDQVPEGAARTPTSTVEVGAYIPLKRPMIHAIHLTSRNV